MAVLNRNPLSRRKGEPATPPIVFVYELKHDLNLYLRDWAIGTEDQDAWPTSSPSTRPTPTRRCASARTSSSPPQATRGDLSELEYRSARAMDLQSAKERGLDAYMTRHQLDAVLFPGTRGRGDRGQGGLSQRPGAGAASSRGVDGKETPDYPLGVTFTGRAWSEATLLRLAYAFEQASKARRPPPALGDQDMQFGVTMFPTDYAIPPHELADRGRGARLRIGLVPRAQPHPDQPQVAVAGRRRAAEMVLRHLRSVRGDGRRRGRHQDDQARHRRLPGGAARSHPHRQGGRDRRPAVRTAALLFGIGGGWNAEEMADHGTAFGRASS